jgi:hypothetical protein
LPVPSGPGTFTFTTQAFLTGGLQLGVSERTFISANVLVPVVGPRGYDIGATFSLSYLY